MNCCIEVRTFLDCSPSDLDPCREFTGNCGDLLEQFKDVPDSGIPDDYECTQFPDEKSGRDKALVGLIAFAVALPFKLILDVLFMIRRARAGSEQPALGRVRSVAPTDAVRRLRRAQQRDGACGGAAGGADVGAPGVGQAAVALLRGAAALAAARLHAVRA